MRPTRGARATCADTWAFAACPCSGRSPYRAHRGSDSHASIGSACVTERPHLWPGDSVCQQPLQQHSLGAPATAGLGEDRSRL